MVQSSTLPKLKHIMSGARGNWRSRPSKTKKPAGNNAGFVKTPRPTHFLCLPIGHHSDLQAKVGRFHSSLLRLQGSVEGLDPSILVKPRRLHFTLGVMCLSSSNVSSGSSSPIHTTESALELLRSLQPQLSALCSTGKKGSLQASLEKIGTFGTNKGSRVLWSSPREDHEEWPESEEDHGERLKLVRVSELVHRTFKDAGYITEDRPLKLHCTLINTSQRKPFLKNKPPQLFSFPDILASDALLELQQNEDRQIVPPSSSKSSNGTIRLSIGSFDIPEIQLCIMGSHGPEDQYVSIGGVTLNGPEFSGEQ